MPIKYRIKEQPYSSLPTTFIPEMSEDGGVTWKPIYGEYTNGYSTKALADKAIKEFVEQSSPKEYVIHEYSGNTGPRQLLD